MNLKSLSKNSLWLWWVSSKVGWEIFMEQELRFGLDFHVFMGKKKFKDIVDVENIFGIEWS